MERSGRWLAAAFLVLVPSLVRAELVCLEPTVDAGEVRSGVPLARRFVLRNSGPGPVEIIDTRPSCGCLQPRLEKRRLKPGEEGGILVEVNTLTQATGPQQWRVLIHYREGDTQRDLPLYITATVHAELFLEPAALNLHTSTSCRHELNLTEKRPLPLEIRAVQTSHPELRVQVLPVLPIGPSHWTRTIKVEVTEAFPEGKHDVLVQLFSDDAEYRELKVPIGVIKQSSHRVQATPQRVSFVGSDAQAIPARIVLLSGSEDEAVEVGKVEADHPAIQCRWAKGPGAMATLKIQINPERAPSQAFHGTVHVQLNKPDGEKVSIPVGWAKE